MKLLEEFHRAILANNGEQILPALKANPRLTPAQQFAIYSEGYRIRLLAAVRTDYPALISYLGDKKFDDLALQYIEQNPPTSYNLDFYPHKFAPFLCANYNDVFAGDLARLEGAIAEVFMLPDSAPILPEDMAKKLPEEFGEMFLPLRKASCLLKFSSNAHDYLIAQRENQIIIPEIKNQYLIIYRHNNEVQRLTLSLASFTLLQQLNSCKNVGNAIDETIKQQPELITEITTNLQNWFANWVSGGIFKQ